MKRVGRVGYSCGYGCLGREAARGECFRFSNEILRRSLGFEMKFRDVPYPDEKRKCSLAERMK